MNKSKILYIRGFKLATCKEWELVVPGFPCSRDHRPCNISKATELSRRFPSSLRSAANIHLGEQTE